ncbi:MAG: hypothetical protein ACLQSR_06820 [Limisphaerales bacterium]
MPWFVQSKVNNDKLFCTDCLLVSNTAYSSLLSIARVDDPLATPPGTGFPESKIKKVKKAQAVKGVAQPASRANRGTRMA